MDKERCKKYALGLLAARMYTCSEIYERLIRRGAEKEDAEAVVFDLVSLGYLDDRKYAEFYILDRVNLYGKGMYRIKQELIKKGVAAYIIDEAIKNSDADVMNALVDYARLKFGEDTEYSYKEFSKIKAHLLRRGYSYGEVGECLEILGIKAARGEDY